MLQFLSWGTIFQCFACRIKLQVCPIHLSDFQWRGSCHKKLFCSLSSIYLPLSLLICMTSLVCKLVLIWCLCYHRIHTHTSSFSWLQVGAPRSYKCAQQVLGHFWAITSLTSLLGGVEQLHQATRAQVSPYLLVLFRCSPSVSQFSVVFSPFC